MNNVLICGGCGLPIGCVGIFEYVSSAGGSYHKECKDKLKE